MEAVTVQIDMAALETMIRRIVKEVVRDELEELWDYVYQVEDNALDIDEGKAIKPEVEATLRKQLEKPIRGIPAEEVYRKLGLDE